MEYAMVAGIPPTEPRHSKHLLYYYLPLPKLSTYLPQIRTSIPRRYLIINLSYPPFLAINLPKRAARLWMRWVGGIRCTLVAPLLQVDIGGVRRMPLWRITYIWITISQPGQVTPHSDTIPILAGPLVWLPTLPIIYDHISLTLVERPKAKAHMTIMAMGVINMLPHAAVIPIAGALGQTPRLLVNSMSNQRNSILAPSLSANAPACLLPS